MEEKRNLTDEELARVNGGVDGEEIDDGIIRGGVYRVDDGGIITLYRIYNKFSASLFYSDLADYESESGRRTRYRQDVYVSLDTLRAAKYLGTVNVWLFEDTANIKDLGLII